jgi:hypothetical protein
MIIVLLALFGSAFFKICDLKVIENICVFKSEAIGALLKIYDFKKLNCNFTKCLITFFKFIFLNYTF